MASSHPDIAVALLSAHSEFADRVRESMATLGTPVVYEAEPHALDREALDSSMANVVVVNLDSSSDANFDNVYDLPDDVRYRVVFNDDDVSGGLTGWDQARWMRHLAAKILGDGDIDPPRPAGAESVPPRVSLQSSMSDDGARRAVDVIADSSRVAPPADVGDSPSVSVASAVPSVPTESAATAGDMIDFDAILDAADAPPTAPSWHESDTPLAAEMSAQNAAIDPNDAVALSSLDDFSLEFDAPADGAPPPLPESDGDFVSHAADLGALDFDAIAAEPPPVPSSIGHDLDFDTFEFDLATDTTDAPEAPASVPSAAQGMDFDALDFDAMSATDGNSLVEFDADDDGGIRPELKATESVPAGPDAATDPAVSLEPEIAFSSSDWTLEDVLDEAAPATPATPAPAFGIEKLRPEEFLAPDVDANTAHPFEAPTGLSLELIPLEDAVAPVQVEAASRENWLDPDAITPKVRRVWVLGASIGGPEAVREFLAALPRDFPALFVLAQHLGDEFVDMMAKQLAQATALTVRTPIHGARVGHGEVVIVPNGKRMLVDSMGVVVLERDTEQVAFSPSIDRVVHDIADRFGSNAGAIVFSGMTDDAVNGCRYLAEKGGVIYAQRQDTCVVSTMIDGVCEAGIVDFLGSPQELAEKLISG